MGSEADIARMDALMEVFKEKAEKGVSKEDEKIFEKYSKEVDILKNYRDKFLSDFMDLNYYYDNDDYYDDYYYDYDHKCVSLAIIADYCPKKSKRIKQKFDEKNKVETFEIIHSDRSDEIIILLYMIKVDE